MKSLIHTLTLLSSLSFLLTSNATLAYGSGTATATPHSPPGPRPHTKLIKKHHHNHNYNYNHNYTSKEDDNKKCLPGPPGPLLSQKLFPDAYTYRSGFTTAPGVSVSVPGVSPVPLNDTALNVIKVQKRMTHNVVWQNGKLAWEAIYPEGSINPSNEPLGGFGFYLGGADDFFDGISNGLGLGAEEVMLSYSVMFEDGFEFNKGGKLPGAFGGVGDLAYGCSGGRQENRSKCFDARLMWREGGAGEIYAYLPITDPNKAAQLAVPGTIANPDFGYSVGRGAFYFPTGKWLTVAQRVRLNTIGRTDGLIDLWVDGREVIQLRNVALREDANATIQGSHFQTFFGGSSVEWASPKTQKAWFADISGAIIKS